MGKGKATEGGTLRKVLLLMGLSMIGVVLFASVALADKPVQDPNCTFEQGETTCTQTVQTDSYIEARLRGTHGIKGCPGGINYVYQNFRIDTYETTTIVYIGKSDRVKSESTESFQTETADGDPFIITFIPEGQCTTDPYE
jgi:hypothetical protein